MITHIDSATVAVADQDAALAFYVNTLGWTKVMDNPIGDGARWVTVAPAGATTQLSLAPAAWWTGAGKTINRETGVSLIAADIDATYESLKAQGVTFKQPVETMPWGMKATWFYDLDGNEFFLMGV